MYAIFRRYEGVDPSDLDELLGTVEAGFLPIVSQHPGFVAYYPIVSEDEPGVVGSLTVFETREGAEESNRMAADFVAANVAHFLPNPPTSTTGDVPFGGTT